MKLSVLNQNAFVVFKPTGEIGLAVPGYFASTAWIEDDEAFSRISGRSFGWTDCHGNMYCDDKFNFTRPSDQDLIMALEQNSVLREAALSKNYVSIIKMKTYQIRLKITGTSWEDTPVITREFETEQEAAAACQNTAYTLGVEVRLNREDRISGTYFSPYIYPGT